MKERGVGQGGRKRGTKEGGSKWEREAEEMGRDGDIRPAQRKRQPVEERRRGSPDAKGGADGKSKDAWVRRKSGM